jgi:hypothetical protein
VKGLRGTLSLQPHVAVAKAWANDEARCRSTVNV